METLVIALGPAFAAGFAVQRLLELLDPITNFLLEAVFRFIGIEEGKGGNLRDCLC